MRKPLDTSKLQAARFVTLRPSASIAVYHFLRIDPSRSSNTLSAPRPAGAAGREHDASTTFFTY